MISTHSHSDYSTLDGATTCTQRAERAVELGQWALALTDHGVLNGIPAHIKACEKVGIQPLLGMEAYYRPDRHVRGKEWQYKRWHLILIAQDLVGWHNLIRLSSESFRSGFYQNPCVDDELLDRHNDGIIFTTACVLGPLAASIEMDNGAATEQWIDKMAMRAPGRFYVEIQPHDFDRQRLLNQELVGWARRKGLPLVAGVDSHYDVPGKADMQKLIALISTNTTIAEAEAKNRERVARGDEIYELGHEGLHMMSGEEVAERFAQFHPTLPLDVVQEAIANTDALAQSVMPFQLDRSLKMPAIVESQEEAERRVMAWCREAMDYLGLTGNPIYEEKLEYERGIVRFKRNFDYLYLIGVIVRWARSSDPLPTTPEDPFPMRKRPIRVGSSRGSAGASLICYLSRITSVDPIGHKLKFERFMNVGRKGQPDIDIDFPDDRRDEVKEFVARLIGRDSIADVAAFSRFTPRAAIQDVARIMQLDYKSAREATDVIDPVHDEDLTKMRERIPQINVWATQNPIAWSISERLENHGDPLIRGVSKHAAGIILTPGPINDHVPTIRASEEDPTQRTAWSETPRVSIVDDFGLVKADFLSITGMTQQDQILARIAARTGQEIDLDQLAVCRDPYQVEPDIMEKFQAGLTLGVNQFEGGGVTAFLKSARPQSLVDLAAINALYRPGPMGSGGHEHYARRRTGQEPYEIPPVLEDVLADTFGSLCFQEQIMELFQVLVGYTAAQADDVRKEIDKLNRGKSDEGRIRLGQRKDEFITGATTIVGAEIAERLWTEILPYTGYSFNRPHATGYSLQAYQDMWLKVRYPADFYAVLMSLEPKKAARAVKESSHFGMHVEGPDINRSQRTFTVEYETNTLLYGLEAIDGIGSTSVDQIIAGQPYDSLTHFEMTHSIKYSKCNKGHRKALLEAGALDSLGGRSTWSEAEKAATEVKRLRIALRPGGTFGEDEDLISRCAHTQEELEELKDGDAAVVAGIIDEIKQLVTKKGRNPGQQMARLTLRFGLDTFSVTLFPPSYAAHVNMGYYLPGPSAQAPERAGQSCVRMNQQQLRFADGIDVLFFDGEFAPLLQKDGKIIVRGKADDRGQIIGGKVMGISEFVSSQRQVDEQQPIAA